MLLAEIDSEQPGGGLDFPLQESGLTYEKDKEVIKSSSQSLPPLNVLSQTDYLASSSDITPPTLPQYCHPSMSDMFISPLPLQSGSETHNSKTSWYPKVKIQKSSSKRTTSQSVTSTDPFCCQIEAH